jgi:hypothetical protein
MISGLLAKPRQRFKTLSKNRCLPTVPTEALRPLWVDSGLSGLMSQRRGSAEAAIGIMAGETTQFHSGHSPHWT